MPARALSPIGALAEEMRRLPQREMPLTHHFAPGIYTREIFMPADTFVIGHVHKTEHLNVVLTGRATVHMEGETRELVAPCIFKSAAGVQKMLYIHEDMRWATVHVNADDETDIATLEERLIEVSLDFLGEKGARTIDELRMAATRGAVSDSPVLKIPNRKENHS